jgi:hypothetical protein
MIELVGEHDLDLVAEIRVDRGPGDLTVVGHALLEHARFDLPLDLIRGQLEHLGAVGIDPGMQKLPTSALRLGRKQRGARSICVEHLLGRHRGVRRVVHVAAGGRPLGPASLGNGDDALHPTIGVSGNRADEVVGAGLEARQRDRLLGPRVQELGTGHARDREVVLGLPVVAHRERGVARLEGDLGGFDEEVTQLDGDRIVLGVVGLGRPVGHVQIGSAEGGFGDESNTEGDDHEESRNRPYKQGLSSFAHLGSRSFQFSSFWLSEPIPTEATDAQ